MRLPLLIPILTTIFMINVSFANDLVTLPVPKGWRMENTAYPPPWAKSLPWKGSLQLRFPEGFFDKDDDFFWSYPILYQLQGNVIKTNEELKRALLEYDIGLYGDRYPKEKVTMHVNNGKQAKGHSVVVINGYDPFTTKASLRTWIHVDRRYDSKSDRTVILLLRSAQPFDLDNPVWKELRTFRGKAGFK